MIRGIIASIFVLLLLEGCSYSPLEPIALNVQAKKVDYLQEVKPILDKRCVSCHSCYNSPCQAKFSAFEGVERGGSKEKVYLAERLFAQDPSRLFIDAKTTEQWRQKRFFSLTHSDAESGYHNSIMGHMLNEKQQNPEITGEYAPETDELLCPATLEEVSEYFDEKPHHGMPYGFPALSDAEHTTLMQWLAQGAKGPDAMQQDALQSPAKVDQPTLDAWEVFLNQDDAKHQMTARYLYEHLFLAHINFGSDPHSFYRLVRSKTPVGEPIDEIATRRPYDDPKVDKVYYRFLKIHSTIVHKTHIVLVFDKQELQKVQSLFIDPAWEQTPHMMDYEEVKSANPFIVFEQIPTASRYAYMLRHNEYFVRTFIRGPVCKGQIALNVIHDHFWVMFQDPKYDIGVLEPEFLKEQAYNLSTPIEAGSTERIYRVFSDRYRERYEAYYLEKAKRLHERMPQGWPIDGIWKGEEAQSAPALTVYRHFDSASVHRGVVGELPRTMWVIDYAHFERIYYALVAGFDVFGNVSHQTNIRRYMDFLRLEGELNFTLYLPKEKRREILASWYIGDDIQEDIQSRRSDMDFIGTQITYSTDNVKQELIERLVDSHFMPSTQMRFDKINYFRASESIPELPKTYQNRQDILEGVRALTAPGTGFIRHFNDGGVNLAYLKVNMNNGEEHLFTLIVNRWHDNVNAMFGESARLDPYKDTLDVLAGSYGSYPNVFMEVNENDLPDFFDMVVNYDDTPEYFAKISKYAISRSNQNFWKYFDWFQATFNAQDPLNAGLYDLNRYYKRPWSNGE